MKKLKLFMKKLKLFRQGDVLLRELKSIPKAARPQKHNGPIVLALGEATGHKHQIAEELENVEVFVGPEGQIYLQVRAETALEHEEHAPIRIPPGKYERILQREYRPDQVRQVQD